jgi:ABC-type dipeptide/oligopeptide/nickel transport system permease subunit
MRIVDIFYGLPDLLIFVLLSLFLGRNIGGVLIALGFISWVRFARIARGQVLQAKELVYVESARSIGASCDLGGIDAEFYRSRDQRSL